MHIRATDQPLIEEPDNGLVMRRLVNRETHWNAVSATWVRMDGRHQRLRNDHSDRIYYVLEGSATFEIGGERHGPAGKGDAILIPRGVPYELEGTLTYLVISAPATHPDDNIYLEGVRQQPGGAPPSLSGVHPPGYDGEERP